MKVTTGQKGFSLLEVLFAVMILTLGMIFVAAMFPVGLASTLEVGQASIANLASHNAEVMLYLQKSKGHLTLNRLRDKPHKMDAWSPDRIHALVMPNVLADSVNSGNPTLVLDDLEWIYDPQAPNHNWIKFGEYWTNYRAQLQPPRSALWFLWSRVAAPGVYQPTETFFLGDIKDRVSPPVDAGDKDVLKILDAQGIVPGDTNYYGALQRALFDVSLERKYCWSVLYGQGYYYIFALRMPQKGARFAVQSEASFIYNRLDDPLYQGASEPQYAATGPIAPGPENEDRLLPVPWRVCLDAIAMERTNYYWKPDAWKHKEDGVSGRNPASFTISAGMAAILRPGSILIDADPRDLGWNHYERTHGGAGKVYEVTDIKTLAEALSNGEIAQNDLMQGEDPATRYWVTLRTALGGNWNGDDLHCFWVFPPAIKRTANGGYTFTGKQPVISVVKVKMN